MRHRTDEQLPEIRCRGVKTDGTSCRVPANLVRDDGYCDSHMPGAGEEMVRRARKGGKATARKNRQPGLESEELPPLTSPEVAEIWLERIARAVATGGLPHNDARAATSALQQWLKAHEVGRMAERLEILREQLEQVKASR